ncbi:hypothetical protein LCL95_00610 [Bacillus timonensis]|nr:hypothetical protein [Bacillus timonensis]
MKKEHLNMISILVAFTGVIGLIMMFASVHFGINSAEAWMLEQEGVNRALYDQIVAAYINTYVVTGSLLFGSSVLGMCVALVLYFQGKEKLEESA